MIGRVKRPPNVPSALSSLAKSDDYYRPQGASQINITPSHRSMSLSHHSHFLPKSPTQPGFLLRGPTHFIKSQEPTNRWTGLRFIWGKKRLSDLCTWGIGGPCKCFVEVFDQKHLVSALRYCHENSLRFMIVGRGSNCLFDDLGFDGCVILNRIGIFERIESGVYRVGSGFRFNRLGTLCSSEGFTGLEFAGGIPGTVGGAAYMNAGANGQETAEVVENIEIITKKGEFQTLSREDLNFGYRSSPFQDMEDLAAIVAVTFRLKHSESARRRQQDYLQRRKISQPIREKSAGSVFQNPAGLGVSAAELIERAGLKGVRVGGAMVSNLHANFFVNSGGSTSQDMLSLISFVKEMVHHKFGVQLKEEVLYVHPYCNSVEPIKTGLLLM